MGEDISIHTADRDLNLEYINNTFKSTIKRQESNLKMYKRPHKGGKIQMVNKHKKKVFNLISDQKLQIKCTTCLLEIWEYNKK